MKYEIRVATRFIGGDISYDLLYIEDQDTYFYVDSSSNKEDLIDKVEKLLSKEDNLPGTVVWSRDVTA